MVRLLLQKAVRLSIRHSPLRRREAHQFESPSEGVAAFATESSYLFAGDFGRATLSDRE